MSNVRYVWKPSGFIPGFREKVVTIFKVNPLTLKIFFFCILFPLYFYFVSSFVLFFLWSPIDRTVNVKGLNNIKLDLGENLKNIQ